MVQRRFIKTSRSLKTLWPILQNISERKCNISKAFKRELAIDKSHKIETRRSKQRNIKKVKEKWNIKMSARRESINKNDAKKPFVTKTSDTPVTDWALLEITCVWNFWKIIVEGESRFSCKIRGNSFRGFSRKGEGKYWFSLIMYRFYSSNTFYSSCYQFTVFIFFNFF